MIDLHATAEFLAHFDRATHTLSIVPRTPSPAASSSAVHPDSVTPITISQSGGGASQPPNTVDLVSTNCQDPYPAQHTFQCDVELRSFFPRSLSNVYAQISAVTLNGAPISGYDGANSDAENTLGLDGTHGIWGYTNASEDPNAISGVVTALGTGFSTGTRTWIFGNAADENIDYAIDVYASEGFSSYSLDFPNASLPGYVDACAGGTAVTGDSTTNLALPFDFTIYNTNTTAVNVASSGQLTFGATPFGDGSSPLALPSPSAPHPAFFPFWDDIGRSTSNPAAQICFQTLGAAPNRQFVIEWRGYDFLGAPGGPNLGASLDFEVFLFEGTGEIDTVYNAMTGSASSDGRENGGLATVGLQDETGTVTTSEYQVQDYGTGSSWGYVPSP